MKQADLFKAIKAEAAALQKALDAIEKTKKKKAKPGDKKILKAMEEKYQKKSPPFDPKSVNAVSLGKLLGISERQIARHFTKHGAPRNKDKTFDLEKYLPWLRGWKDDQIKRAEQDSGTETKKDRSEAEVKLKQAQAELQILKLGEQKGDLVSKETADERVRNILYTLKTRLSNLPNYASRIMGKSLVGTRDELQEIVFETMDSLAKEAEKPVRGKK